MTITPEEIMAYVDGELDEGARARITLAALTDIALADRIAAERALRNRLQAHYAPVADAPVPSPWVDSIGRATARPEPEVINLAAVRDRKAATLPLAQRWWTNPWSGAAIAASLVLGVFVGTQWQGGQDGVPVIARDGALVASGDLARALDTQLASAQNGAPIRIMGTFRRSGGDVCRAFLGSQASGIACHAGSGWQLQHLLPGSARGDAAYQQAGAQDAELMAIAQGMAAGDSFDADQEREAKSKGWR